MNLINRLKTFLWVGFCATGCLLYSCTDKTGGIGIELQNPNEKVFVFNDSTMQINTYTMQQPDSIYVNPPLLLLGYMTDPVLGQFQNNFMTEIALSTPVTGFNEQTVADSLVLSLGYTYCYGDIGQTQIITIYELNRSDSLQSIQGRPMLESVISEYYNPAKPLMTFQFKPNPTDSVLRIKLPDELRDRLVDTLHYDKLDVFNKEVLRGFYFVAGINDGGAISYINLSDSTRMELFFHDTINKSYEYVISDFTYRCNTFKRSINPTIKSVPLNTEPDISYEQDLFYIKNNNTFEGRIDISGLQNWADTLGDFTINKAVLLVYAENPVTDQDSLFYPHSRLMVKGIDDDFTRYYLPEYPTSEYRVKYDSLENGGYGYRINLKNTLFNAIKSGGDKVSLILQIDDDQKKPAASANIYQANRTILRGADNSETPVQLKVMFTKFNAE